MLQSLLKFLFYNEQHTFIKKNVLSVARIALLEVVLVIHDLFTGEFYGALKDIPILLMIIIIWWLLKYRDIYYSNLVFLVLVPAFSWVIFDSISYGLLHIIWSFPIIAILYFCFYKYVAWLATAIILLVTVFSTWYYFSGLDAFNVCVALLMVSFCFILTYLNVYQKYDELKDKANRDPMTNLLNRSSLEEKLLDSIKLKQAKLDSVVLCIDVDNFKTINDTFGHLQGDNTLISIARLFADMLPETNPVFRMGGEEFLVLMSNVTFAEATATAENIRSTIATTKIIAEHQVTVSIGVAMHREHEDWGHWLKRSDGAMYQAKKTGKNKVVVA